jgi:TetR/AcrR family transcriptional regulator, transcriptional repressor for nem operon
MPDRSTRDHLIEVGLLHMQQTSYCSTGINEVLALAGVSKGAFYHHFQSKEEFGSAVLQRHLDAEDSRTAKALSNSALGPIKRLRTYFEELISVYGPHGSLNDGCLLGNLTQEMANRSDPMRQLPRVGFRLR